MVIRLLVLRLLAEMLSTTTTLRLALTKRLSSLVGTCSACWGLDSGPVKETGGGAVV